MIAATVVIHLEFEDQVGDLAIILAMRIWRELIARPKPCEQTSA